MKHYPQSTVLADVAEDWMLSQGHAIPSRDSNEWKELYESWVKFAFDDGGRT